MFKITKDEKPRDMITMYKKLHSLDPGPIYNEITSLGKTSPVKINPLFVKFSQSKISNFIDNHVKTYTHNPGVGKYDIHRKHKILGNYNL